MIRGLLLAGSDAQEVVCVRFVEKEVRRVVQRVVLAAQV